MGKKQYINNGNISYTYKRYEEAIQFFDKALELSPKSSVAFYNKGLCLYYLNRYDEANMYLDKTIELNDSYVNAYYWKPMVLNKEDMKRQNNTLTSILS